MFPPEHGALQTLSQHHVAAGREARAKVLGISSRLTRLQRGARFHEEVNILGILEPPNKVSWMTASGAD